MNAFVEIEEIQALRKALNLKHEWFHLHFLSI
jgi:hypothetical protein